MVAGEDFRSGQNAVGDGIRWGHERRLPLLLAYFFDNFSERYAFRYGSRRFWYKLNIRRFFDRIRCGLKTAGYGRF